MKKILKSLIKILLLFFLLSFAYFFLGFSKPAEEISWGVVFSQKHAQLLGLDWKENYSAILDELGVKKIKIITHWDLIEPAENKFHFEDLDWQIQQAKEKGGNIILVIGMKTGRWPECHIPSWLNEGKSPITNQKLLEYIKELANRYKHSKAIWAWQIENEPFFSFGQCPKIEGDVVEKEIALIKSIDQQRPIILADSGEFSFWIKSAKLGDIVSATLHRRVYFKEFRKYISYPFPPVYYWRKAKIVEKIFGKKVIVGELQAEPWCKNLLYNCDLVEQKITMDFNKLKDNIEFAKKTGLDTFYFWGVEWWYWLKEKRGQPEIWQEIKNYFK